MIHNKGLYIFTFALTAGLCVGALTYLTKGNQPSAPPPVSKDISGVYLQRSMEPDSARFRLEIHPDGRWAMANMMTGLWGSWQWRDGKHYFKTTVSPSGPVNEPKEEVVTFDGNNEIMLRSWKFDRMAPGERFEIPNDGVSVR